MFYPIPFLCLCIYIYMSPLSQIYRQVNIQNLKMVKLSFFMLLPLLLVLSSAQNSPQDVGYDRFGGDLPGMPIGLGPSGTAALCDALCVKRRTCSSWAYDTCTSSGNCWLKNTDRPLTPSSCRVSNCSGHATVSVLTVSNLCRLQPLCVMWKCL